MNDNIRFAIVEDNDNDLEEVLNVLADFEFNPKLKLGQASTYEHAKEVIEENADSLDVLFLDLNIPKNNADGKPEKGNGRAILDLVHEDLNRRANIEIKVIVVSGEDLIDGVQDDLFKRTYKETLVGIVQKANLSIMLKANLKRLRKDPLRSRMSKNRLDVIDDYDKLIDPSQPIKERAMSARAIAIRLVMNELDHFNQKKDSCSEYSDDLNSLIDEIVKGRFSAGYGGKVRVKKSTITAKDGWEGFLWRGQFIQHLYTLNSIRNTFIHMSEQPLRTSGSKSDTWEIPDDVLLKVESGEYLGQVIELIVRELLDWYLPWHEQVYLPYFHPTS